MNTKSSNIAKSCVSCWNELNVLRLLPTYTFTVIFFENLLYFILQSAVGVFRLRFFSTECVMDLVESTNWNGDCRIYVGYNRALVTVRYSLPSLTVHPKPLPCYILSYFSLLTWKSGQVKKKHSCTHHSLVLLYSSCIFKNKAQSRIVYEMKSRLLPIHNWYLLLASLSKWGCDRQDM
jgi:hypothetical protein